MTYSVTSVSVQNNHLLELALPRIDYADAFALRLEAPPWPTLDALAHALLGHPPDWVVTLLRLRNAIVRPFGLKTGGPDPEALAQVSLVPGDRVGIFRVFARTDDELLLGDDDRHLDFRVSLRVAREPDACVAVMTTVVCFHNLLGRAYFLPVAPMHRVIVPAMLRAGAERLKV